MVYLDVTCGQLDTLLPQSLNLQPAESSWARTQVGTTGQSVYTGQLAATCLCGDAWT